MFWGFGMEEDSFNIWAICSEKSTKARRRENEVQQRFDNARKKLEKALWTNKLHLVELGCNTESDSYFRLLPVVTVEQIIDFVRAKPKAAPVAAG
jgi:hypothetical protein